MVGNLSFIHSGHVFICHRAPADLAWAWDGRRDRPVTARWIVRVNDGTSLVIDARHRETVDLVRGRVVRAYAKGRTPAPDP